ncbi:MAG: phosphatidylserine/phosphatidylglycerophosphate/cardiolipin synthase family protein, partial [Deltaproteobacteria bacterium]|nr:phosphatidylserine/phosphatidylglycerophosphate/cardiolipin synthase family protein [Deltaproteobacteria bacterium]
PGHQLAWHAEGREAAEALLREIANARRTIDIQLYILEADAASQAVVTALGQACKRGVRVRLLLDGLGCSDADAAHLEQLTAAGAAVRVFRPLRFSVPWRHLLRRNHRKVAVFDGESAIVTGRNVGEHYLAMAPGHATWLDLGATVRGPAVTTLARQLNHDWRAAERKHRLYQWLRWLDPLAPSADLLAAERASRAAAHQNWPLTPPSKPGRGGLKVAAALSVGKASANPIADRYLHAVQSARTSIWLVHAYFLPDHRLTRALVAAARRGVQVRVVLPDLRSTDVKLVALASLHGLRQLMKAGVQVRLLCTNNLHAKFAVVDDVWWTMGSANLDALSRKRNLEANLAGYGREPGLLLARLAQSWFDLAEPWDAVESSRRPRWLRWLGQLAWRFRALL